MCLIFCLLCSTLIKSQAFSLIWFLYKAILIDARQAECVQHMTYTQPLYAKTPNTMRQPVHHECIMKASSQ